MESKSIFNLQPTDPELQPVESQPINSQSSQLQSRQHRPTKPYRRYAWMLWMGWLVFAALLVVMLSRSLQPRMPGMPATGGYMNMNDTNTGGTTTPDNSMPGMNMER